MLFKSGRITIASLSCYVGQGVKSSLKMPTGNGLSRGKRNRRRQRCVLVWVEQSLPGSKAGMRQGALVSSMRVSVLIRFLFDWKLRPADITYTGSAGLEPCRLPGMAESRRGTVSDAESGQGKWNHAIH
jgi:hypothetical protein